MALNTQDLLDLKDVIEESYTDGISAIISAEMNGEAITGIFRDGVKQYEFNINPDDPNPERQLSYKLLNPEVIKSDRIDEDPTWLYRSDRIDEGDLVTYFEVGVRVDAKKNCTKGTACGSSCIPATKTCRKKEGLSDQGKAKAKNLKEKLKKEPAAKAAAKNEPAKPANKNPQGSQSAKPSATTAPNEENSKGGKKSKLLNYVDPKNPGPMDDLFKEAAKAESADDLNKALMDGKLTPDVALSRAKELGGNAVKNVENFMMTTTKPPSKKKNNWNGEDKGGGEESRVGAAASFRKGPKIESQEDFSREFEGAYDALLNDVYKHRQEDGFLPIAALRESLGDRVSREQFDSFIRGQLDKGYTMMGGAAEFDNNYSTERLMKDGITTPLGGSRFYIQRDDQKERFKRSNPAGRR